MRVFNPPPVLVADQDTNDCLITLEAWEETGRGRDLKFMQDGTELMDYLYHRGHFTQAEESPLPGLIILGLEMPPHNGIEVLSEIKNHQLLRSIPVVILSRSHAPNEISHAYSSGAYDFIVKPGTFHEYLHVMRNLRKEWLQMTNANPGIIFPQHFLSSGLPIATH